MARQPMTDEQKQAAAAKRQATRMANQEAKAQAALAAAAAKRHNDESTADTADWQEAVKQTNEKMDADDDAALALLMGKDDGPAPKRKRASNQSQKALDAKKKDKKAAAPDKGNKQPAPDTDKQPAPDADKQPDQPPADDKDVPRETNGDETPADPGIKLSMAQTLRAARAGYATTTRPHGGKSADCGDGIAQALRDMEPEDVAAIADKVCGEKAGFHQAKYQDLNRGQMRMNSGNKIRGAYKKAIAANDTKRINEIRALVGLEDL